MKCIFCKQPAGFLKSYHDDCQKSADNVRQQIEDILNQYKSDDIVPAEVKQQIRDLVVSNNKYKNYVESMVYDKTTIYNNEVVIYVESMLRISESKNRCRMVETGFRYEKKPCWDNGTLILDNSGIVIFTDKAIYFYVNSKTMRYPYNKIVNYGYDKIFSSKYAYLDVKTSSPFPHRFSFTDTYKGKDGLKEQNIVLFIHSLK
ncbi:MAG: hypothetical protein IKL00_10035 [Oscillospiraceae bacterium]|nr:hypothetical protein [Oscillospiraceae bacterium]